MSRLMNEYRLQENRVEGFYYGTAVLQNIIIEIETGHEKE